MKISEGNSKLGKIPNISMTPIKACGNCKACAKACYALKAYRQYPATRKAWDHNFAHAKKNLKEYFADVQAYLIKKRPKFFRWHVSGDILSQEYFGYMVSIAILNPKTHFLVFTKMHALDYQGKPDNLEIVFSMFPGMPDNGMYSFKKAWYQDGTETRIPANSLLCPGTCESCGMCWQLSKLGRDVYFMAH